MRYEQTSFGTLARRRTASKRSRMLCSGNSLTRRGLAKGYVHIYNPPLTAVVQTFLEPVRQLWLKVNRRTFCFYVGRVFYKNYMLDPCGRCFVSFDINR